MARREPTATASAEVAASPPTAAGQQTREALMAEHAAACRRRDSAALGSDEFRRAAEDVARIEIAIAAQVEGYPAG